MANEFWLSDQDIGRSRGGPTTKIHALTDGYGRISAFHLMPGNIADISAAPDLLAVKPDPCRLLADRGFDAGSLRDMLADQGTEAVIPSTRSRKRPIPYDAVAYRARNMIERTFVASRISGASQPAMTSSRKTSCQPSLLQPSSSGGLD